MTSDSPDPTEVEEAVSTWMSPVEIVRQRALGWPDFHPETYCHKCGRPNIRAWFSPEWPVLYGHHGGILCPVCFAAFDTEATWRLTRHHETDAGAVERLAAFLASVSELGDDAPRVASCLLDTGWCNAALFASPASKDPQ